MNIVERAKALANLIESSESVDQDPADVVDIIRDLLAVVERLPQTADGVPVVPGDTVYDLAGDTRIVDFEKYGVWRGFWVPYNGKVNKEWLDSVSAPCRVAKCYSTRQAAEDARSSQ